MEKKQRNILYAVGVLITVVPMFAVGFGWFRPANGWFGLACFLTSIALIGAAFLPGGADTPGPEDDPMAGGTIDLTDGSTTLFVAPPAPAAGMAVPVTLQIASPEGGSASVPIVLEVRLAPSSSVLPPPPPVDVPDL